MWIQLAFLVGTGVLVGLVRRNRLGLYRLRHAVTAYSLAHLFWLLALITVLSNAVADLAGVPFLWGALGKILTLGVLLAWPVAVVPARSASWVTGTLGLGLVFLGLCDLAYWRHFGSLFPVTAVLNSGQAWDIRESITALLRAQDWSMAATALACVVVMVGVPRITPAPGRKRWGLLLGVAVAVAVGLGVMTHNLVGWRGRKVLSHARWARHVGVYGVHVLDTARAAGEWWRKGTLREEDLAAVGAYLERARQGRPAVATDLFGVARGSNVLVVQLESVQGFVVGARVDGEEVTPFLNSLTETAAYYPLISDQSGEANTADTEYLVHNSQHPMRHGAVVFRRPDNEFVTWTKQLRDQGYATLSAHPWDRGFWNRATVHPRYGYERMMFRRELGGVIDKVGWGSSDRAFFEHVAPALAELKRPYSAYLITLMSHHPYTFYPAERRRLTMSSLSESMLRSYLHMMHEVDRSLRDLVRVLTESGVLDNTLLVVFGDHDARLAFPSAVAEEASRTLGLSVDELRQLSGRDPRVDFVPLFIRLPGGELTGTVPVAGGQIDIGPTILFLLGQEAPTSFLGQPLVPGAEGFAARIDGSALDNERMFVSQGVGVPAGGLCLRLADRAPLPHAQCAELAERASEQVSMSWKITDTDMATHLEQADD